MSINDQAKPPYQRIADDLRKKIERGELAPGAQLPSIRVLAAEYHHGTMTIQRAVNVLREDGLVSSTQGHGTFVRSADEGGGRSRSIADHLAEMESGIAHLSTSLASLQRALREMPQGGDQDARH